MKKLALALLLGVSFNSSANVDPVQECELYMSIYDIVTEVTGEVASNGNPVHRSLVAGVLAMANQIEYEGYLSKDALLENVRNAVTSVYEAGDLATCNE